jgi:hypothetical protein
VPRPLSKKEVDLLTGQRINAPWVYARSAGEELHESIAEMRRQDKYVLHGFSPCECGVSLRSRRGDCLSCHPKQLEHLFKYTESGYVYILCSWRLGLTKVGSTGRTPAVRAAQLNGQAYAGAVDWWVCDFVRVSRRGLLEDQLKAELQSYCIEVPFTAHGRCTYSRETFDCPVDAAQRAMIRLRRDYLGRHRKGIAASVRVPPDADTSFRPVMT